MRMIKDLSRLNLVRSTRGSLRAILALSLLMTSQACVTRREIQAAIWLNNSPIPKEFCERDPDLKLYGFYRRLDSGKLEFMPFCNSKAREWVSMHKDDFNRLMDIATEPDDQ